MKNILLLYSPVVPQYVLFIGFLFSCPSRISGVAVMSVTKHQVVQFLPGTEGVSTICTRRHTILQGWGFWFVPRSSPNPFLYCMSPWHWINSLILPPWLPGKCWSYQEVYRDTSWLMREMTPELVNAETWKCEPHAFWSSLSTGTLGFSCPLWVAKSSA